MKIAFLNYYQTGVARGLETFITQLSLRLIKNHQVLVLPSPAKSTPASTRLSLLRRFFLDPASLRVALWTLKSLPHLARFQPKIVFCTNGGWQALIVSLYCRLFGAKLVIVGQSGPGWDDRWNLFIRPNLFVTLTNRQLEWAKLTTIWKQDFALIPNGVDLDQFKTAGNKFKTNLQRPIIMMVAATTPDKRVEQGIRAVVGLKTGSLLLLGNGPLDERVNKLGYELLGEKRFFHTSVSHDQMPDYYRCADLFTLCSTESEAFGIVYLEAMATGLPCVATDDESRHEIIGKAGVFVKNPDDTNEYSRALKLALKTNWQDLSRKQAEKFSWDSIAEKYEEVL